MLHKGKLQAALNRKHDQFSRHDGTYREQLRAHQQALETLYQRYASSAELESVLPDDTDGMSSAGARPSIEFDRWLANATQCSYHGPVFRFGREFANHEQARQWAECVEGLTTIAVDGSQLLPWRDASVPVALIQVGFFVNPHAQGCPYTKDVRIEVLAPDELMDEARSESSEPDSYPYSDMQVTLRRHLLEVETLCSQMEQWASVRRAGGSTYDPVVFFDGSLIVSFAAHMPDPYRQRYIDAALLLLSTSERLRVPLVSYIDTSYARDIVTMLGCLDSREKQPLLGETRRIHDALLWKDAYSGEIVLPP